MKLKTLFSLLSILLSIAAVAQKQDPLGIALRYIEQQAGQWALTQEDITNKYLSDRYQTQHNGLTHLYFRQQYAGMDIIGATLGIHVDRDGQVAFATSTFVPDAAVRANATAPALSAFEAVRRAAGHLGIALTAPLEILDARGKTEIRLSDGGIARQPIRARLVYQLVDETVLRLAWDLSIYHRYSADYWSLRIDAATGDLLEEGNFTLFCRPGDHLPAFHQAQCQEPSIPSFIRPASALDRLPASPVEAPRYRVFPLSLESPLLGDRELLAAPSDAEASPFGWHDTDGRQGAEYTITRGNNVHAYIDLTDADTSRMDEPDGGGDLLFDFPFNADAEPSTNRNASVTQLFYANNVLHDLAYHYGFDEAAGNFQQNNYNRGGRGGDAVNAHAQDGGALNNANFTAPPDGENGRIQMYLWTQNRGRLFSIDAPEALSGPYEVGTADFGPEIDDTAIAGRIVDTRDNSTSPTLACETIANADEVAGNIAMIDRGLCFFEEKAKNAEAAGAIAVIICNYEDGLVSMGGVGDVDDPDIPVIMLKSSDCARIRQYLNEGVEASMQRQLSSGPDTIDGAFDNGVIAHEYAHGISIRLTGGPSDAGCLFNDEQMGEGWSDFFTLAITLGPSLAGSRPRGIGNYIIGSNIDGSGIRRQPYSTDMSINDQVFDDIIATGSSPHQLGEVWTAMLWDLYWAFIDTYGWDDDLVFGDGGNNMALQLVIDAMKIQACRPGFIEARDAILAADAINHGGANECLIYEVFARRGLGWSATQGSSEDRDDGFQAFDIKPECIRELKIEKEVTELIQPGGEITVSLTVINHKDQAAEGVTLSDRLLEGTQYLGNTLVGAELEDFDGSTLTFQLGRMASGERRRVSYRLSTPPDRRSIRQFFDDVESGDDQWVFDALTGVDIWEISEAEAFSGDACWFAPNTGGENDQFLRILEPVRITGRQPVLRFYHRYDTEPGTDGGLIEVSTDGGANWEAVPRANIFKNNYRGQLAYQTFSLPFLEGYWGRVKNFIDTYIDLSPYAGEEVFFRFRFGSLENAPGAPSEATGWFIDDIELMDLVNYNSEACVSSEDGDLACASAPSRGTVVQTGEFTSIDEAAAQAVAVNIYPNPAHDWINVAIRSTETGEAQLSLVGLDGRMLRQSRIRLFGDEQVVPIDGGGLAAGVYLLRVQTAEALVVKKVILN